MDSTIEKIAEWKEKAGKWDSMKDNLEKVAEKIRTHLKAVEDLTFEIFPDVDSIAKERRQRVPSSERALQIFRYLRDTNETWEVREIMIRKFQVSYASEPLVIKELEKMPVVFSSKDGKKYIRFNKEAGEEYADEIKFEKISMLK